MCVSSDDIFQTKLEYDQFHSFLVHNNGLVQIIWNPNDQREECDNLLDNQMSVEDE